MDVINIIILKINREAVLKLALLSVVVSVVLGKCPFDLCNSL